jgi:hypothetical protein
MASIGGLSTWAYYGRMLTDLIPSAYAGVSQGKATASSKDHRYADSGRLYAYWLGMKKW